MDQVEQQNEQRQFSFAMTLIAYLHPEEHVDAKKKEAAYKYLFYEGKKIVEKSGHFVVVTDEEEFKQREIARAEKEKHESTPQ